VLPAIQGYLNRLFKKWSPGLRRADRFFDVSDRAANAPNRAQQMLFGFADRISQLPRAGMRALASADQITGYTGYITPEQAVANRPQALEDGSFRPGPFTGLYQQRYGIPIAEGDLKELQGYILGNFRDAEGNLLPIDPDMQKDIDRQKASNDSQAIGNGLWPTFISKSSQNYNKWSDAQMEEAGYWFDEENQQWVYGGPLDDPQTLGAAAPYGYGGSGYPYYGGRGGGGGGYVGGDYTYPQSFVGREQRGATPQANQNRAARFGAVTWRI
jgi:hypothetical protein